MTLNRSMGRIVLAVAAMSLIGCGGPAAHDSVAPDGLETSGPSVAQFDWFDYSGDDPVFANPPEPQEGYLNPILTGFYPDPSITRAGDDFYLVTSTFAYFPGIPVMHSRDLVNWTQVGNVIDRPGMLDFDGLGLSRGVFAPTISYHGGTFFVANTCVDCGGNFIVTATDPAGPWSDPVWLPDIGGIDPSLFFDVDGKVYVMNNDVPPEGSLYEGHRAIWIREVDPQTFQSISEPVVLINGGVHPEDKPIWIEGPHIYRIGDWYYLSAAEGGTAVDHSQVVLRAQSVTGPYTAFDGNPILTQRHLPEDRPDPITSVGHADLVQDGAGRWWATFLGVRPYEDDFYNTGRETFLMPVDWEDGWPIITRGDDKVPYVMTERPTALSVATPSTPTSGNFAIREEFDGDTLPSSWMTLRVPETEWWSLADRKLRIKARPVPLGAGAQPSLWGRRQQHQNAVATTSLTFSAKGPDDEAGLAALQSDDYFYALGLTRNEAGESLIRLRKRAGPTSPVAGDMIASRAISLRDGQPIELRITARADAYDFSYRLEGDEAWTKLASDVDGKLLSTREAGGFVGAIFGLYAESASVSD
ncbi:glycoside hydrolase family 43 protein [Hyphomonas johnsonii]|uniref:Xylan 1,4-beta-xylosidase n=1 Tax=Hyphomonas johnsonii MHS-2 TaxID=1280950 RepID=A0A059FRP8_9PROT|nr:glycoside hydrolase family 43 protein [Hyphomonas johnsonii]KCZ93344.1 xylan 1,4-beta-xylosidase [Hyphomonas johnsonii MHS-2]